MKTNNYKYPLATILSLLVTSLAQYSFGRSIICKCGYIKLWQGSIWNSENSQHLTDLYTLSHIIHGFGFYYFGKYVIRKLSLFQNFLLALTIESIWEIIENSSFIIDRYREGTISLEYYGDSIINSSFDILAMTLGFYLARKLPLWLVLFLTLIMEIGTGYLIRDNLTFNIIMVLYPLEAIRSWQLGAKPF